jgi:hypothetical protein
MVPNKQRRQPHNIYYAWQWLLVLQVEQCTILWFKLHNIVSQLKRKSHAVINHSNIQEQIIRVSGMGANPSRTQTINLVLGIVNRATNAQASSLALQIDFMGMYQGSRSTPIYHSCKATKQNLNYHIFFLFETQDCVKGTI